MLVRIKNQKGIVHAASLLVIVAAVGLISFLLITATLPTGGLSGILNPKLPSLGAAYSCTMFIGYSQTNNWFGTFLGNVSNPRNYEELISFGGAATYWTDPNYEGWNNPKSYPCSQDVNTPDRIVFDITHNDYLSRITDPVGTMEQIIRNLIPVIRQKYPSAQVIILQPVVGGPGHNTLCLIPSQASRGGDGSNFRASANHPYIYQAIGRVANGTNVLVGNDSHAGSCSDYGDEGWQSVGHIVNTGPVAIQIANFYEGGTSPPPPPPGPPPPQPPPPPPAPTPSPSPFPASGTVTFNDKSTGSLNGEYPNGVINWGSGNWLLSGPYASLTTNNFSFNGAGTNSDTFSFVSPRRIVSFQAANGGTVTSTVTLSCANNPTVSRQIPEGAAPITITTNWVTNCSPVTLTSTNGWNTNFDNFVLSSGAGATPVPTPAPTPASTPGCPKGPLGDLDCDEDIDIFDFNTLISNFDRTGANIPGDLDKDGDVDIFDFNNLITNFGS